MNTLPKTSGYTCYPCADTGRCLECDGHGDLYANGRFDTCEECWGKGHCLDCEIRECIAREEAISS